MKILDPVVLLHTLFVGLARCGIFKICLLLARHVSAYEQALYSSPGFMQACKTLCMRCTACILQILLYDRICYQPSRSPQYWLVGRQVKCHPAAASHAVEGEVVDPGTSARSRHNVLACRSGAPAAEQPRINGMTLWPVGNLLWPILGALAYSTA